VTYRRRSALTAAVASTWLIASAPVWGEQLYRVLTPTEIQAEVIGRDITGRGGARAAPIDTVPGVPPVIDPRNLYSETAAGRLSPTVADALPRIYVPNRQSNSVSVIDPATYHVVDHFKVGISPQHVVPSWDLRTLWVANNGTRGRRGSLTPIDPKTGKPDQAIPVDDPYNLYFTPDGRSAIVVAETRKRLDFRDPHTMALQQSLPTPSCSGVNHADFSIDGRYAIFTCEFRGQAGQDRYGRSQGAGLSAALGSIAVIDFHSRRVETTWPIPGGGSPDMGNLSADGKRLWLSGVSTTSSTRSTRRRAQ
jgi:YVTN family beta-propeller protein